MPLSWHSREGKASGETAPLFTRSRLYTSCTFNHHQLGMVDISQDVTDASPGTHLGITASYSRVIGVAVEFPAQALRVVEKPFRLTAG